MGRHSGFLLGLPRTLGAGAAFPARPNGHRFALPAFSFVTSLAMVLVFIVAPIAPANANSSAADAHSATTTTQHFVHANDYTAELVRDNYGATSKPKAPIVAMPDPGTAQAIAYGIVVSMGWGDDQFGCLVSLWDRESHWNSHAMNPYSGAYGIPQALPGNKMASAGADWETNPATQIRWGLGYISSRYGTPCAAWEHSETHNWY